MEKKAEYFNNGSNDEK